ncbi:3-oxo-tetronate kinase [Psychromarinibacter sediminicola]|uniref:3-oxo-tetronate kinase n=1 Tax=Psychromarinibacter sediminicola TaxID=3033385 RepID=UPI002868D97F|nr:3-oxo-tetronate kinase [Psychromarinibacter sediminicola]
MGDDFTGSSDLANTLARGGMACVQFCGVPDGPAPEGCEAGIVALKTRSVPAAEAVAASLRALAWLRAQGCRQYLFKYCSTFDSTPEGNIAPVARALARALDARAVPVAPAFPALGRSVYQGHLFVGDRLLSESGMEAHPLNPMTDPDIRRWLDRQGGAPVAHLPQAVVAAGREAIRARLAELAADPAPLVVCDTVADADLVELGAAAADRVLLTGGSGIALGLPENFRAAGAIRGGAAPWRPVAGPCVALSGSCSTATRAQVARHERDHPVLQVSLDDLLQGRMTPAAAMDWIAAHREGLPLVSTSAAPDAVAAAREGRDQAALSAAFEGFFAELARLAVADGTRRLVVAGGETSGAVVTALGLEALEIGPEIDPGVPAMRTEARGQPLGLALKSGNFGAEDFFAKAAERLGR